MFVLGTNHVSEPTNRTAAGLRVLQRPAADTNSSAPSPSRSTPACPASRKSKPSWDGSRMRNQEPRTRNVVMRDPIPAISNTTGSRLPIAPTAISPARDLPVSPPLSKTPSRPLVPLPTHAAAGNFKTIPTPVKNPPARAPSGHGIPQDPPSSTNASLMHSWPPIKEISRVPSI